MTTTSKRHDLAYVRLGDLQAAPRNPKGHDLDAITESLIRFGYINPVILNRPTGRIVAGHGRLEALRQMRDAGEPPPEFVDRTDDGEWLIPVVPVDFASDEEAEAYLLADNRTTEAGGIADEELLLRILQEHQAGGGLEGTGYDDEDLQELLQCINAAEAAPSAVEGAPLANTDRADVLQGKWQVQPGDLWLIPSKTVPGKYHRLLCGDATEPDHVKRLLAGATPVLMSTDPPYGVQYDSQWRAAYSSGEYSVGTITGDDRADWSVVWALWQVPVLYVWHGGLHADVVAQGIKDAGYELRAQIIWNKSVMVFGRGHYHWKHEPCWYAVRRGHTANWSGDRSQHTVWEVGNNSGAGRTGDEADDFHGGHISQKPVDLFRIPIRNHTERGDIVAEPFAGSGSQYVAAEELGRLCYGMELEPKFCAVILERLSEMGLTPERDGDGHE